MSRKSKVNWSGVDWAKRDVDIAKEKGCSRERVRQVRKDLGKPKSPLWHKRVGTAFEAIDGMDTSGMLPRQVAKEAGCSEAYALQVLRELEKDHEKPPDGRRKWKYDWASVTDSEWQELTDVEVAEKLGVPNPAVVTQWRRRKGIVKKSREAVPV
jgi:hypothetical protein